jgi:hypothetical protein
MGERDLGIVVTAMSNVVHASTTNAAELKWSDPTAAMNKRPKHRGTAYFSRGR